MNTGTRPGLRSPAASLILGALPAIAAGLFVLSISHVGRGVWRVQGGAIVMMLVVALALACAPRAPTRRGFAIMACLGLLLCAFPLFGGDGGPARWVRMGSLSLYVAPVVAPAFLAVAARALRWGRRGETAAVAAPGSLALVLACQPDLAQVLAMAVAGLVIIACCRLRWSRRLLLLLPFAAAVGLAAVREVPLLPVSYVEQSLRVSWAHSIPAGLGVSMAALAFLAVVAVRLSRVDRPMIAVAAYYAVLFACSLADLTPAPLIGYGSGHLLGFGLLVGTVSLLARGGIEG